MQKASKKKKGSYKIWLALTLVFLLAAGTGAFFGGFFHSDDDNREAPQQGMLVAADKATVMIMGVDQRKDDVGRSDTLMIATIDPKNNQAALLSVPRDTRVKIPGFGWDKINAAYAYGGYKLTRRTVEQLLDVPINHYIIINIQGFQKIIDAIGGVDINVEKRMVYNDPYDDDGGLHINIYPGLQHMNGKEAIAYVRYRDTQGDIGRIYRQQKFMRAVMEKVLSPAIIPRIPSIVSEVMDSVKTDMSLRELLAFFGSLREAQKNGLRTDMVPGTPMYIDGISYWIPNITKLRSAIADTLDIPITPAIRREMEQTQLEYKSAIPATAKPIATVSARPEKTEHASANKDKKAADKKSVGKTEKKTPEKVPASKAPERSVPESELQEPSAAAASNSATPSRGNMSAGKN